MKELDKYKTIKKLVETGGNKTRAAISIGCSKRHINRMIQGYMEHGKEFFLHGNHGRKPATKTPDEQRKLIIDLYNTKYTGANFTHYAQLLRQHENIHVSSETIRTLMLYNYTLSPKAKKGTKVRIRKKLEAKQKAATSKKEAKVISSAIVGIEQAHPRRPRCAHFGEVLQLDASVHPSDGIFTKATTTLAISSIFSDDRTLRDSAKRYTATPDATAMIKANIYIFFKVTTPSYSIDQTDFEISEIYIGFIQRNRVTAR